MQFNDDISIFIDPSYSCSGCMALTKDKKIEFAGFSRGETKRDLQNYYNAAISVSCQVSHWLNDIVQRYKAATVTVVMEIPFDGSYASSGLWMLQCALLSNLKIVYDYLEDTGRTIKHYTLTPSYISGQVKKANNKKDSTGIRKKWCLERLEELKKDGYMLVNPSELQKAGCDRQTAFGFWYFLSHSDKELPQFKYEV